MLQIYENLYPDLTNGKTENTVMISLEASSSCEISKNDIVHSLQGIGIIVNSIDFTPTKTLISSTLHDSLNAAVTLRTRLSQGELAKELKQIGKYLKNIKLSVITFNKIIINKRKVIETPSLLDYIKQLQPDIFSWD